jgi:threonine dehydrogenase-like Zn-dependent dehydrogenase
MTPPSMSKCAVLRGPRDVEITEWPVPEIGDLDGLLRVEATGVCGADWAPYKGDRYDFFDPPLILGHEIVGRIEAIGKSAAEKWAVKVGDRVVLEEPLPCWSCTACLTGVYQMCEAKRYGCKSVNDGVGLWGGYSEYVYLAPNALMRRMSPDVPAEIATLYVPISNGLYWVGEVGGLLAGDTVVVQGPGQQGLGCVIAAKEAGAAQIIVTGLAADRERFEAATKLGADVVLPIDECDPVEEVARLTGGEMAHVVVNVTEGATAALGQALRLAGNRASIVHAGNSYAPLTGFEADLVIDKELTIRGVRGRYGRALEAAIRLIESERYPLEVFATHAYAIEDTERALLTLGGEGDPGPIHVSVLPTLGGSE